MGLTTTLRRIAFGALLALPLVGTPALAAKQTDVAMQPYLGRWDMTLVTPEHSYASWLEIREQKKGQLRVRLVSRWGHARWLPQASIVDQHLRFVSPKKDEERPEDMVFEGSLSGDELKGTVNGLNGATWTWTAERAPALVRKHPPRWGEPIVLFDGKDLNGWAPVDATPNHWHAIDGQLASLGSGADLRSNATFDDFKLHIEFNCAPGANSGVYLRGRYELQIEDDVAPEGPDRRTAAIYGYLAPVVAAPRTPGVWQSFDITMIGRRVTVVLNGKTLINNQEIPGITGGAIDSHEGLPGPIVLQGGEPGQVVFRNIVLTPALPAEGEDR